MKKIKELFIKFTTSLLRSTPPLQGGESMKGNPLLDKGGESSINSPPLLRRGPRLWRGGWFVRNAGIIVGAILMVLIAGYIFRDKIPFFSATGNDPVAYWKFDEEIWI